MENKDNSLKKCHNCDSFLPISAKYCYACGQKFLKRPVRDLWPFLVEGFQDVFNINSRLFTTPLKLFIPGALTLEFIKGKRRKYASPIRLFLMFGILFLFVLNYQLKQHGFFQNLIQNHEEAVIAVSKQDLINNTRDDIALFGVDSNLAHLVLDSMGNKIDSSALSTSTVDLFNIQISQQEILLLSKDSIYEKYQIDTLHYVQRILLDKIIDAQKDLKGMVSHLIGSTIWLILAMIPFFALILKFIYIRKKRYFLEHFIFGLHLHTFYLVLLIVYLSGMGYLEIDHQSSNGLAVSWMVCICVLYTYIALKRYYQQSYVKTFFKMILISFSYLFNVIFISLFGLIISAALF